MFETEEKHSRNVAAAFAVKVFGVSKKDGACCTTQRINVSHDMWE
jgi:hypothetical protein